MPVIIYDTESNLEIALKIWNELDVMQSVRLSGLEPDPDAEKKVAPKGELVLRLVQRMYEEECYSMIHGRSCRKYNFKSNSIGGPIAHKIFTWEMRWVNGEPRHTIWRYQ